MGTSSNIIIIIRQLAIYLNRKIQFIIPIDFESVVYYHRIKAFLGRIQMKKFFSEFGAFIAKGNAIDLAVGIVIGTAFNAIIKSLVADIIMPLIGLIANVDVKGLYFVLRGEANFDTVTGQLVLSEGAVLLTYGNFIQTVLDFLIIAFAIFLTIKVLTKLQKGIGQIKTKIQETVQIEK
jgi:large conductance mechanosensitive channel